MPTTYIFLNLFIHVSIPPLCSNALGFKKPNVLFDRLISINLYSISLRNRSTTSSMQSQRFIFSAASTQTSSLCSSGIFFFYWTRRSSIGFSCSSQMPVDRLTSGSGLLINKATILLFGVHHPPVANLFWSKYFSTHYRNFSDLSLTNAKKMKNLEKHLTFQELDLAYHYFLFDHKARLMLPYTINILVKRFQDLVTCTPVVTPFTIFCTMMLK